MEIYGKNENNKDIQNSMRTTKIELTEQDAKLFLLFRKHQDEFKILTEAGFFGFKNGCAIIHRDPKGILKNIEVKTFTFTRRREFTKRA